MRVINEEEGTVVYAGPTIPNFIGTNFHKLLSPLNAEVKVFNDVNAALLGSLLYMIMKQIIFFALHWGQV